MSNIRTADEEQPAPVNYDGPNDQIMLHRLDGPFASKEDVDRLRRGRSINEPTPLIQKPDGYRPERFEAAPPPSDQPPQLEAPEQDRSPENLEHDDDR